MELLVVMAIIGIALAALLPSLGTSSGRSVDAAAGQLKADLEQARLIAIAERTRTMVIFPTRTADVSNPTTLPSDITLRGYLVLSKKGTETVWKQRGKWNRFSAGAAIESISPTPAPTAIPIDIAGTGTTSYTFNGPYIEFLSNGSSNLDPNATPTAAVVADGFVDSSGTFVRKNQKLQFTVTVDPLTGSVLVK